MKKIFTLLTVALAFAGMANAQRVIDLAAGINTPTAGSNIQGGTAISINGMLTNNGPDTINGGQDTIFYQFTFAGTPTSITGIVPNNDILPTGTFPINLNNIIISGEDNPNFELCLVAIIQNRSDDSVANEVARGTFTNNAGCNTYNFLRGYGVSVNERSIVVDNGVSISPNPANDALDIAFFDNNGGEVSINFFDLSGKLVKSINTASNIGLNHIHMDIQDLPVGMFSAQVIVDGNVSVKKVAVTR